MIKNILSLFFLFGLFVGGYLLFFAPIADKKDYDKYLVPTHLEAAKIKLSTDINFWSNKLKAAPNDYSFLTELAGLYAAQYKLTGDVQQLQTANDLLESLNKRIPDKVNILHALTANAITRHDFKKAEQYAQEAYNTGELKHVSALLKVDVALERGRTIGATSIMRNLMASNKFDYLIRNAKIKDHEGNLTLAIEQMEQALDKAKASGKSDLINWSLSNLGDMYGHDNRIRKSYKTYLAALAENPADLHSLKGIAWVLFSHDKNVVAAKRIINFLKSIHPVPDYDLLLAEIAHFEGQATIAYQYEQNFLEEASKVEYGNMYKSYISLLKIEHQAAIESLEIARQEIEDRPSPASYDLLAWATFHTGQQEEAVEIIEEFVIGQTEEPMALFHCGVILEGVGKKKAAKKYLNAALDAGYELGPLMIKEIHAHLNQI